MEVKFNLPDLMQLERYYVKDLMYPIPNKRERGIYALFKNKQLVYIGESINLRVRLRDHINAEEMKFTMYTFQIFPKITKIELLIYEAIYINLYRPPWNNGLREYLYK